jgi:hypothetical protein
MCVECISLAIGDKKKTQNKEHDNTCLSIGDKGLKTAWSPPKTLTAKCQTSHCSHRSCNFLTVLALFPYCSPLVLSLFLSLSLFPHCFHRSHNFLLISLFPSLFTVGAYGFVVEFIKCMSDGHDPGGW